MGGEDDVIRRVGTAGAWARGLALTAGVLLLAHGTFLGNDVQWPFAPMSQFAFRVGTDDVVHSTFLQARTADGRVAVLPMTATNVGMVRAEVEGEKPALIRDPELLGDLAGNYARLHPGAQPIVQLWLRDRVTTIRDRRAAGVEDRTLVTWSADGR